MNEKEQKTADMLLDKIQKAPANRVGAYAEAYKALTQGSLNRVNTQPRP